MLTKQEIKEKKLAIDRAREKIVGAEEEGRRAARKASRRCFWTRPLGHRYSLDTTSPYHDMWVCLVCGKESFSAAST